MGRIIKKMICAIFEHKSYIGQSVGNKNFWYCERCNELTNVTWTETMTIYLK